MTEARLERVRFSLVTSPADLLYGAMLRATIALMLAAAVPATAALADPAPQSQPAQTQPAQPPPSPTLGFYPPAAKAAGVEGEAIISCGRDVHLALVGCTLVSEIPVGQGFGAAALAMAAKSPANPKVTFPDAAKSPPAKYQVRFSLHPPSVTPDLTAMAHTVVQPSIVTRPSHDQIKAAYPVRALDDQVAGGAVLDCLVTKAGALTGCQVAAERPTDYGFGAAALDVSKDFVLKPRVIDGEPVDGAEVRVGVAFTLQDPSAPLTIDTPQAAPQ
jgi:TonB family protein